MEPVTAEIPEPSAEHYKKVKDAIKVTDVLSSLAVSGICEFREDFCETMQK